MASARPDREAGISSSPDTIFRVASLTKPIVSATALALIEQGRLSLSDTVDQYLPAFQPLAPDGSRARITIRQLMMHTAGLSYSFLSPSDAPYAVAGVSDGMDRPGISLAENMRRLASVPLRFTPGERFHYSLATDVLGAVIEGASGMPLAEGVRTIVTAPLGMNDTGFYAADPTRLAPPYHDAPGGAVPAIRMPDPTTFPSAAGGLIHYSPQRALDPAAHASGGAGMITTSGDYLRFVEAIRSGGGSILSPASARLMTTDAIAPRPVDVSGPGWGFGLGVGVLRDPVSANTLFGIGTWRWAGVWGATFWVDPGAELSRRLPHQHGRRRSERGPIRRR